MHTGSHAPEGKAQGGPEEHRSAWGRLRSRLRVRSVAGQVFLWLLAVVVLLVAAALTALILQARNYATSDAANRTRAAAVTLAHYPGMAAALDSANPTAVLQPLALDVQRSGGFDYIVIFGADGTRYAQTAHPELIGKHVYGDYKDALKGPYTVTENIPLGPDVDTTAPITRPDGSVAGFLSVGYYVKNTGGAVSRQLPVLFGGAAAALAVGTGGAALVRRRLRRQTRGLGPAEMTRMYEHHDAVLHAVREGVLIVGGDGRVLLANDEARRLLELPPEAEGRPVAGLGLDPGLAELLASGRAVTDEVHLAEDRLLAVSSRPTAPFGGEPGSVATIRDTTELRALAGQAEAARTRLRLLYDAGLRVGTTLDVVRTAQELADVSVPRFADFVTVELAEPVLRGDEPLLDAGTAQGPPIRRVAASGISEDRPFYPVGSLISPLPGTPEESALATGRAALTVDLRQAYAWRARDPQVADRILAYGVHSLLSAPLKARGLTLGTVSFWRAGESEPFGEEDVSFAEELVARAAITVDNARRYTREHRMAETLQRSLLPRGLPEQSALEAAYRYLPAQHGVGGDWFDVIPLPGFRVALVVGDVVGHGLHAAATMGRLRTAVLNFSALDLPPDELLARLDELITRLDQGGATQDDETASVTGATCLYAIYDPVSGHCTMARAGHPPPALVHIDGSVEFVDLPAGPPLGVGGLPFESAELKLAPGSALVLYTNGLVANRDRDLENGLAALRAALAGTQTDGSAEETCQAVFDELVPPHPSDDIALLIARTRLFEPDQVATWDVPHEAAAVSRIRNECVAQLEAWGLEELTFSAELILSELITNAIRHGAEPIRVRMLRDRSLVFEVSDGSSTAPHLRYAADTDEGGRGLFLVAQLAERWGTRYTARGKIIWAEQSLTVSEYQFEAMLL
ncbi:SpoIIE family protein phosphatase [Kitasatospora kifunensis]|uniref:Serine phosphatase RsbU (Regulator of sigma subunit)/anti-sigma regulatory factor (Ser/Thr protein kinase) n=1 Tax=Kitasatospora kifunensis TaxID=58351 RepID=A0A7W7VY41_KITKI|nr:SpoIIE family protein phosphatase [Kitasatospora kifunensis]MBB4926250.1 serine phosphatase RsbU (regulator of sigma subunit)/anti-sigma regulatory factor (Ser/Thr protein kinase) [Kitasatospora kifunensis]